MKLYARVLAVLIAALLALGGGTHVDQWMEENTATPQPSQLSRLYDTSCRTVLDGTELPSLLLDDTRFVEVQTLCSAMEGVSVRINGHTVTLYDNGQAQLLNLQTIDGDMPLRLEPDSDGFLLRGAQDEVWMPLERLQEILPLDVLWDEAGQTQYLSVAYDFSGIPTGKPLPVLMYHCISNEIWGYEPLFMSPDSMRQQLQFLVDEGYEFIRFSDLTHLQDYEKPIIITLDDGYEDNYYNAFPIIQEFGIPVTIFMITSFFGRDWYLTEDEVREMVDSGLVSVQSHTTCHAHLTDETDETIDRELYQSKLDLARVTGRVPYVLSYPTGRVDQRVVEITDDYYSLAVKTNDCQWVTDSDIYEITRISLPRDITLEELQAKLNSVNAQ